MKDIILVTGGAGFVGSNLIRLLVNKTNKKIISLISTINLEKLKKFTKVKNIVRATPLPPIEIKKGPIIICPPSKFAKNIFKMIFSFNFIRHQI